MLETKIDTVLETKIETQVNLADQLIGKLERIHGLWSKLPTVDEVCQLTRAMDALSASMKNVQERYCSGDFPKEVALSDMRNSADSLAASLKEAAETYISDDFPNVDALDEMREKADSLASSLKEAGDRLDSDGLVVS